MNRVPAAREPGPFVTLVLSRTVEKADSDRIARAEVDVLDRDVADGEHHRVWS